MQEKLRKPRALIDEAYQHTRGEGVEGAGVPDFFDARQPFDPPDNRSGTHIGRFVHHQYSAGKQYFFIDRDVCCHCTA